MGELLFTIHCSRELTPEERTRLKLMWLVTATLNPRAGTTAYGEYPFSSECLLALLPLHTSPGVVLFK